MFISFARSFRIGLLAACAIDVAHVLAEDLPAVRSGASEGSHQEKTDVNSKAPSAEDLPTVTFIFARHVILYEGQVVTFEQIEQILNEEFAELGMIRPVFLRTNVDRWTWKRPLDAICQRLYDAKKASTMTTGTTSARASARYDRIKSANDLVIDDARRRFGKVIDAEDKPQCDVQIFLLPAHSNDRVGVQLQNGQLRNPYDEHVTLSDSRGDFETDVEPDEQFIAAVHRHGFALMALSDFESQRVLRLMPWARMHGHAQLKDTLEPSVRFMVRTQSNVELFACTTKIAEDGTFDERCLPPGSIVAQRTTNLEGRSICVSQAPIQKLGAGEETEIELKVNTGNRRHALEDQAKPRRERDDLMPLRVRQRDTTLIKDLR